MMVCEVWEGMPPTEFDEWAEWFRLKSEWQEKAMREVEKKAKRRH
jgi:hypothetical protein